MTDFASEGDENAVDTAAARIAELIKRQDDEGEEDVSDGRDQPHSQRPHPSATANGEEEFATDPERDGAQDQLPPAAQAAMPEDQLRAAREAEHRRDREQAAIQHIQSQAERLDHLVPQLEASIAGEFGDVKSLQDLERLATSDPERYNTFVIRTQQLSAARGQQQQMAQVLHQQFLREEHEALHKLMPEMADERKAPVLKAKLARFAKQLGYSDEQLAFASARDILTINKAMRFDEIQRMQADAQRKAAHAPPVQRPGMRKTSDRGERVLDDFKRLQETGDVRDAAEVFKSFLG